MFIKKASSFVDVLTEIIDERDKLQLQNSSLYSSCDSGSNTLCKSLQELLDVKFVNEIQTDSILKLLEFFFERAYKKIDYLFLLRKITLENKNLIKI